MWRHGQYTQEAIAERRMMRELLRESQETAQTATAHATVSKKERGLE
jgi:hypothetical protein